MNDRRPLSPGVIWRSLAAVLLAGLVVGPARGAIDFTPTTGERKLEGSVFKQLIFHEEGHAIAYEQPRGWTYSGGGGSIAFAPPGLAQAKAEIQQTPLSGAQKFDAATIKTLQDQVLASLPKEAQQPAIIGEENSPIMINGQPTYEVTIGYTLFGQEYQVSVLFVNLPDTQLRFRVAARKQDFEKVHRLFRGSLCSLQWSRG